MQANKSHTTVLEVGGGYGGLALQLYKHNTKQAYINIDLLETLCVSYYILKKSLNKNIRWLKKSEKLTNTEEGEIVFVPSFLADNIDCDVTLAFNSNSFSEMGRESVEGYFSLFDKINPSYILHQNSNFLLFPDSNRHIEVLASEFPINLRKYVNINMAISLWRGAGGRYREYLYIHKEKLRS